MPIITNFLLEQDDETLVSFLYWLVTFINNLILLNVKSLLIKKKKKKLPEMGFTTSITIYLPVGVNSKHQYVTISPYASNYLCNKVE